MYDQTPGYDGRIDPRALDTRWTGSSQFPRQCWDRKAAMYAAKVTFMDKWLGGMALSTRKYNYGRALAFCNFWRSWLRGCCIKG